MPLSLTYKFGTATQFDKLFATQLQVDLDAIAAAVGAAGQFPGTNTNDNAAAGNVGEYVESIVVSGSAVAFATGTAKTVTSISLTAGDWDVSGTLYFKGGATTTVQYLFACTSATTDSADLTPGAFVEATYNSETPFAVLAQVSQNLSPRRVSLSGTTTYYLVGLTGFGVSTNSGFGIISARRVR